ncbi:MAG TPA: hypothetical protein VHO67_21220 [Polyangia bacterium]|nr:hypothetical protein [Polyangia bacterium]
MQVVCATCQLSFDAPEGATGLVCPICRGPLRPQSGDGAAPAAKTAHEWAGGDLDDVIAILSAPAVSARVEVLAPKGDDVLGEVHLLAGGVSESIFGGKSTDDALDRLRALNPTRFRIEQRLPNPVDGSLTNPGPETGTLDGRALAHLMRYCEDYVISCAIEVWRGNETARVEYRRGEISGVTVGGIDAPERLAEVMQWSSGNYRLIVPPFQMPATAPKRTKADKSAVTPVPVPAASAQAARQQATATKTIFGMPVADIAKARIAPEAAKPAAATPAPQPVAAQAAPAATRAPTPAAGQSPVGTPARSNTPAPMAVPRDSSPTRTIFGVPAPQMPEGFVSGQAASEPAAPAAEASKQESARQESAKEAAKQEAARAEAAKAEAARVEAAKTEAARAEAARNEKKTGARKVEVPAPAMAPPPAAAPAAAAPAAAAATEASEPTTRPGFEPRPEGRKRPEPAVTQRVPAAGQTSVAAYVGVGFAFGLALLGIYELYAMLAH